MNCMEKIAQMLGLEFNENFHIKLDSNIILESEYRFTEKGLMRYHKFIEQWDFAIYDTFLHLLDGKYEVVKIPESILTEQEKFYLSTVIKPYRKKVKYICKLTYYDYDKEYLYISLNDGTTTRLPDFDTNAMYKGMELGRYYSLEELGLWIN